jgi:hypothetical protein
MFLLSVDAAKIRNFQKKVEGRPGKSQEKGKQSLPQQTGHWSGKACSGIVKELYNNVKECTV